MVNAGNDFYRIFILQIICQNNFLSIYHWNLVNGQQVKTTILVWNYRQFCTRFFNENNTLYNSWLRIRSDSFLKPNTCLHWRTNFNAVYNFTWGVAWSVLQKIRTRKNYGKMWRQFSCLAINIPEFSSSVCESRFPGNIICHLHILRHPFARPANLHLFKMQTFTFSEP